MRDLKFISSVSERDIDLLILEELSVNEEFRDWFSTRVYKSVLYDVHVGAAHSVYDPIEGETDLQFIFNTKSNDENQAGKRIAILIENKIDAIEMPTQGERYKKRGEKGIQEGDWQDFRTCMIAPNAYLNSDRHEEEYNTEISYEELAAFFSSRRFRDERYRYKAAVIQEGIDKVARRTIPIISREMTEFVTDYYQLANSQFPRLRMQPAKDRPAGSTWIMFKPAGYPKNISLWHQMTAGAVKLLFADALHHIDAIREKCAPFKTEDMDIELAGNSVGISVRVPKLEPLTKLFQEEAPKVVIALEAAVKLDALVRKAAYAA